MFREIQDRIDTLTPAEKRVAAWILAHPRQACRCTLSEMAQLAGSSEPTVVRFCRRFGLAGFRDLAVTLTEALSQPTTYIHHDVEADDHPADAATKVVDASIQSLFRLRAQLSSLPLAQAAGQMRGARQLVFAGLGASGHVARDAAHKFFRLGLPCMALTDTPSLLQYAAVAQADDVFIVTSHSGRWSELASSADMARARGATVIALTGSGSALASHADIVFPTEIREDTSVYTPMSSRLAHLALLDALQVSLALALGETAVENLRRCKDALA